MQKLCKKLFEHRYIDDGTTTYRVFIIMCKKNKGFVRIIIKLGIYVHTYGNRWQILDIIFSDLPRKKKINKLEKQKLKLL